MSRSQYCRLRPGQSQVDSNKQHSHYISFKIPNNISIVYRDPDLRWHSEYTLLFEEAEIAIRVKCLPPFSRQP